MTIRRASPHAPAAPDDPVSGRRLLAALGCAAFVLGAVLVEMVSGQAANTPSAARYEALVPLGWPAPLRVGWWLVVAAAAVNYRRLLHPSARRRERALRAGAALPFGTYDVGIAVGADWATWH